MLRAQWGVITRAQLYALGWTDGRIARAVAAGQLIRLHRGVYAVGHDALRINEDPRQRAMCAPSS